ncbi:MAG TPA: hypothetical protein VG452_06280 [Egibacteraceae bacterium]|nr:hypothetical protein [Egibacteraceae bacterium]
MSAPPEAQVRAALRTWLCERNPGLSPDQIDDRTPLIESRYLTSLQVVDLLLLVEQLRAGPIDPAALRPGVFRDINTIYATFFDGAPR